MNFPSGFARLIVLSGLSAIAVLACPTAYGQTNAQNSSNKLDSIDVHDLRSNLPNDHDSATIPIAIRYQLLFIEVLADQRLMASLPEADQKLLRDIRSPMDERFLNRVEDDFTSICADYLSTGRDMDVERFMLQIDESRRLHEKSLDDYYSAVTALLSESTRSMVDQLMLEQDTNKAISYARLDLIGLAADHPDAAAAFLQTRCGRHQIRPTEVHGASYLLDPLRVHLMP